MSAIDESGPAFPIDTQQYGPILGMSLRDYFAAKAMQAMVTAEFNMNVQRAYWAEESYRVADAMLAERAGKQANNDEPKSGDFIQYFSVAEGRWIGGKFIGMSLGRHVVESPEGNVGTVEADQIRFAERAK